jgi:hypothetical protein
MLRISEKSIQGSCFSDLLSRKNKIKIDTSGRQQPIKNQGQNFRPVLFAKRPEIIGNPRGTMEIRISKTISGIYYFAYCL